MTKQFRFTEASVRDLPSPAAGQRDTYRDTEISALVLRVSEHSKVFNVFKKLNGRPVRVRLGTYPELLPVAARKLARRMILEMAEGKNPNVARRAVREETTLGEAFAMWLEGHCKPYSKPKTAYDAQKTFDLYLKPWETKSLSSIRSTDVSRLHQQIAAGGRKRKTKLPENAAKPKRKVYAANATMRLLRQVFNQAIKHGWQGTNPVQGLKFFKEQPRQRFLEHDEMPKFLKAVEVERQTGNRIQADFLLCCLFTGIRRGNIASMRWQDVNLERATWLIQETKTGQPQRVYLPKNIVLILRQRKADGIKFGSPFVFPGPGITGYIHEPKFALRRICKSAEIAPITVHGLRHTFATYAVEAGINPFTIALALGHKVGDNVTRRYSHIPESVQRQAMEKIAAAMLSTGTKKKKRMPRLRLIKSRKVTKSKETAL